MTFDVNAIPSELRDRQQWLIWRFEDNPKKPEGKKLKVPYYANGTKRFGNQGDAKDRAKLVTFDGALKAMEGRNFSGVGFAFLPGDGLIGIDIDGCIDLETGEVSSMADELIRDCASYTEYSPSRTGVHIIVAGNTQTFKSDKIGLEVFSSSQFFTFTANVYGGSPCVIAPIGDETLEKMRRLVQGARPKSDPAGAAPRVPASLADERAKLESALAYVSPEDYRTWFRVGMAIYSTLGDAGLPVWDYWSSKSEKYAGIEDLKRHWKTFGTRGQVITAATVYHLAMQQDWRPPKPKMVGATKGKKATAPNAAPPTPENDDRSPVSLAEIDAGLEGMDLVDEAFPPPPTENEDMPGVETPGEAAAQSGEGRDPDSEFLDNDDEKADSDDGKKKKRSAEFWEQVNDLIANFVLLYGTNTAWDDVNRMQIKITDLRYAFGSDPVKYWLASKHRRMINSKNLVFDPTGRCDPKTSVNLFYGFEVEPQKGDCSKILDLLSHLCDNNQELMDWILKWIAYPLRHPGAKMTTSIIMHGDEGSGKNLFFEKVVRRIYGTYAGVIGNAQIESQFNEWASRKLFFVCDEVVTRNELKQLKGKLKHMISGDEISINPKNLPERQEANHMNFVFLSNELQPLALDKTDRRYLVVWTPPKKDLSYYKEVADQAYSGGMEAFYHYLMYELDMGDFNEHTKPLETAAKRKLISLGLEAPERFYREWSAQALPLPFVCCSAMQLYAAFQRWCHLNGERFPPSQTVFGGKIERMAAGEVTRKLIKYDLHSVIKQRTAYLVHPQPEGKSLSQWVEDGSGLFESYLKKYRNVYDQSNLDAESEKAA